MCNVRLSKVCLWLLGAKATKDLVIHIEHRGKEDIWDPYGNKHAFMHDYVNFDFRYEPSSVKQLSDCEDARGANDPHFLKATYDGMTEVSSSKDPAILAAFGPFTCWTFTIKSKENQGLDLSTVTGAFIEFRGYYHSLDN